MSIRKKQKREGEKKESRRTRTHLQLQYGFPLIKQRELRRDSDKLGSLIRSVNLYEDVCRDKSLKPDC